jgi:N-acetylglucosaminyldiphosphoundecaprenol N-acetyl-beta-D-mannosaminyltransferase
MTNDYTNIQILGVRIDNFSVGELKRKITEALDQNGKQLFIATLNPEILLKAHRDEQYRNVLNAADINICDGFGIKLTVWLKGKRIKSRFTGVDLVRFLMSEADRKSMKILVVAAKNSLSKPSEIEMAICRNFSHLEVKSAYFEAGQMTCENGIMQAAEIVFVNFGAPNQEKFIYGHRSQFPNAKVLAGIGGTFDFLTGKIRRAPNWVRGLGLEWLWRLLQEPKRIKRIWNAVVVFPTIFFFQKRGVK